MGKKSPPPKPPDLKPLVDAQTKIADQSNELAREYLGLSREQYAWMKENATAELDLARQQADRLFEFQEKAFTSGEEMNEFARQVGQSQMDAMNQQMGYAKEDRARWDTVFKPMQDRYISEANAYDTPERREAEAARAQVDVQRQSEAARNNADARLRSMGLDPSQMRSNSMMQQMDVAGAANQALAGNMARTNVEDKGRALRADAINMGNGLPAQAAAGFAGAGNAGAGALNAGQAGQNSQLGAYGAGAQLGGQGMGYRSGALANMGALTGSPMQWAGMGGNMMGQSAGAYGNAAATASQGYQNQMSQWQNRQSQQRQNFYDIAGLGMMGGRLWAGYAEGGAVESDDPEGGADPSRSRKSGDEAGRAGLYIRRGAGHGEGGALNMRDRVHNGLAALDETSSVLGSAWGDVDPLVNRLSQRQLSGDNLQYAAEGGRARGAIPMKQVRDKIPAYLAEGEYIVPADVVRSLGVLHFDKLVKKFHRENA